MSTETAIATLRELTAACGYRIVSLTHEAKKKSPITVDTCTLPHLDATLLLKPMHLKNALASIDSDGLAAVLESMVHHPRRMGYFRDLLFTTQKCGAQQESETGSEPPPAADTESDAAIKESLAALNPGPTKWTAPTPRLPRAPHSITPTFEGNSTDVPGSAPPQPYDTGNGPEPTSQTVLALAMQLGR